MKKPVFIVVAIALLVITLSSFISYGSTESANVIVSMDVPEALEGIEVEVNNDVDYYEEYLQELNTVGPKESSSTSVVSANSVLIDPSEKTIPPLDQAISSTDETASSAETREVKNPVKQIEEKKSEVVASVDHSSFGTLLKKHVDSKGNVNYQGFKKDEAKLDSYLDKLRSNPTTKDMSKNERLAYWINVYNAFTIKLILENYPVNSIKDINGGKPWDKQFITLGNTTYSLNMVENEVIRKRFTEPRIHFAVNCAAKSCPPLLNDAFYPATLTNQLAERTTSFLKDKSYNTITNSKVEVSKIFDWYGVDFGDVNNYISTKVDTDISGIKVTFKEYDWSLNKQ